MVFLATLDQDVCKISGQYLKNCGRYVADIHTYRQKGETGEARGKPKYVAELRTGKYTVEVCGIAISTGLYRVQVSGKVPVSPSAFQNLVHIIPVDLRKK